jgi:hypothetical protein
VLYCSFIKPAIDPIPFFVYRIEALKVTQLEISKLASCPTASSKCLLVLLVLVLRGSG